MITRRELLAQLGGGACAASIAAVAGCGAAGQPTAAAKPDEVTATLRARLVSLVDELEQRYPIATALAVRHRETTVGRDSSSAGVDRDLHQAILIQVFDGASWHAQSTGSLSPEAATSLAARLANLRPPVGAGERRTRDAQPRDFEPRGDRSLSQRPSADWLQEAEAIYDRAVASGSSRTIYRAATANLTVSDSLFVGAGINARQNITRVRAAATFVARSRDGIVAEQAVAGGTGGREMLVLSDGAIETASQKALAIVAADFAAVEDIDVILDFSVTAAIARAIAAGLLNGRQWVAGSSTLADKRGDQVGDAHFGLRDDPTLGGGYASYDVDDEGASARATELIEAGIVRGPYTDRLSAAALGIARTGHARLRQDGVTRSSSSNLIVAPGKIPGAELLADVERGYVLESATVVAFDPRHRKILLRVRRAREILRGGLSGRIIGPLMVRADVFSLLLAVRAASSESHRFLGSDLSDDGVVRSIDAPMLLTRAEIGP